VRGKVIDVLPLEGHHAFLRAVKSIDAIEDAGFPRSVGANDGQHLSLSHIKTDAREGSYTSKIQPDVVGF
jgi:hypothetical protein